MTRICFLDEFHNVFPRKFQQHHPRFLACLEPAGLDEHGEEVRDLEMSGGEIVEVFEGEIVEVIESEV